MKQPRLTALIAEITAALTSMPADAVALLAIAVILIVGVL